MKQNIRAWGGQNGEPGVWPMIWELRFVLIFGYFLSRKSIRISLLQWSPSDQRQKTNSYHKYFFTE